MKQLIGYIKRNTSVFVIGLLITLLFLLIIFGNPADNEDTPPGFIKVEEEVFENRDPQEPTTPTNTPEEYASQVAKPENKGKRYFYGEYNPELRDDAGYPTSPAVNSTPIPPEATESEINMIKALEYEEYQLRNRVVHVSFSDKGFTPADEVAFTGGRIIWTNNTDHEILIEQTLPIHERLKNGVPLQPGESFEFRPLLDRFFSYVESNSKTYGTISIVDSTRPLVENWE